MPISDKEDKLQLLALIEATVAYDDELRKEYGVGEKFRFIHEQLRALLDQIDKQVKQAQEVVEKKQHAAETQDDELSVYVYLYNAQGLVFPTWQNLLIPKLYYEYSVNRPIYTDKGHVESLLRSKASKAQHGYITLIIKKSDILTAAVPKQDALGHTITRVREGSLLAERFVSFTHNDQAYELDENGKLQKKANDS